MRSRTGVAVLLAACAPLLAACSDDAGLLATTVLRPAALAFYGDSVAVTVPDSARVGVPFLVHTRSFGDGCTQQDQTGIAVVGRRVDVRPLVREPGPASQAVCAAILLTFTHSAPVTLTELGTATIVVHGRSEPGASSVSVTRTVRVVP
jgi:hypothetical protein